MTLLLDSGWECFGGNRTKEPETILAEKNRVSVCMEPFSAKYYLVEKLVSNKKKKEEMEAEENAISNIHYKERER